MKLNYIAVLLASLLLLAGCAATGQNQQTQLAWYRLVGQLAAYDGASIRLRNHPEDRAAFEKAYTALKQFNEAETVDPVLLAILLRSNLPISELKSDDATIILTSAVLIFEQAAQITEIKTPEVVKAFGHGIEAGLALALATQ